MCCVPGNSLIRGRRRGKGRRGREGHTKTTDTQPIKSVNLGRPMNSARTGEHRLAFGCSSEISCCCSHFPPSSQSSHFLPPSPPPHKGRRPPPHTHIHTLSLCRGRLPPAISLSLSPLPQKGKAAWAFRPGRLAPQLPLVQYSPRRPPPAA